MSDVVIALVVFLTGAVAAYIYKHTADDMYDRGFEDGYTACEMFMGIDDTHEFDDLAGEDDDV